MPKSRRRASNWDSPTKNRVIGAVQGGLSVPDAAAMVGMPYPTARDLVRKVKITGSTSELPRSGRPPLLDEDDKDTIEETARLNRRMPFKEIGNQMEPAVSESAVRRTLQERGYRRCVAPRVPYLTQKQKDTRYVFALERQDWRAAREWNDVMWSDECYVRVGDSGRIWVTRRPDEKWDDDCVVPKFTQSPLRVMVWGCIARGYRGGLKVLEFKGGKGGGLNAKLYQEQVLEDMVLPEFTDLLAERPGLKFQQDSAPSHRAKTTKAWFVNHGIPLFPHPSSSPDISPIEPLWHVLKSRLMARPRCPTTLDELIATIIEEWEGITIEDVDKYIDRMPRVMRAVIDANGGHTRY